MRVLLTAERERCPRAKRHTSLSGGLGTDRPARLAGLRGARCTGAGEGPPVCTRRFQETRPGVELRGQSLGERRGGAPKGERVPLNARPRPKRIRVATSDAWRGPTGQLRLFGAPPPFIFFEATEFVALVGKPRARGRRENEIVRAIRPRYRGGG